MYIGNETFRSAAVGPEAPVVPPAIDQLYRREREVALIVYRRGLATATDVQGALSASLSNPAIRSMLNRLVAKGVLTRTKCGPYGTFIYGPAVTAASARETALRQLAEDFYAGSLSSLAGAIADLFANQRQSALPGI